MYCYAARMSKNFLKKLLYSYLTVPVILFPVFEFEN